MFSKCFALLHNSDLKIIPNPGTECVIFVFVILSDLSSWPMSHWLMCARSIPEPLMNSAEITQLFEAKNKLFTSIHDSTFK